MTREHPLPGAQPVIIGVIGAGRVGRAVTAAAVTNGLADAVLVRSRRSVEATALAPDAADLAATQHAPTRVDAVEHVRELQACLSSGGRGLRSCPLHQPHRQPLPPHRLPPVTPRTSCCAAGSIPSPTGRPVPLYKISCTRSSNSPASPSRSSMTAPA